MSRANRDDVARLAGVSVAVVSYVLNNGPRPVAPETRDRVLAAMSELRYRPNASARALKLARTDVLGLLMPDITNPYFSEFTAHLHDLANDRGYGLMIGTTGPEGVREAEELRTMLAREVDGIAVYGARAADRLDMIVRSGVRVVTLDSRREQRGVPSVTIDDYGAAREAIEHLISHGYSEVAFIGGQDDPTLRQHAWTDAMGSRCTPERLAELQALSDFTLEGGYRAAEGLLDRLTLPAAILSTSDVQAFGALRAIRERGLSVPGDIAIVSVDGTNASAYSSPALTTVHLPLAEIARHCVDLLTGADPEPDVDIVVPHLLIERGSCGPHPEP